jgi:hypothetical protein
VELRISVVLELFFRAGGLPNTPLTSYFNIIGNFLVNSFLKNIFVLTFFEPSNTVLSSIYTF